MILIDKIEDDAGNALMRRHLLYGGLDQLARRSAPLNDENGFISQRCNDNGIDDRSYRRCVQNNIVERILKLGISVFMRSELE